MPTRELGSHPYGELRPDTLPLVRGVWPRSAMSTFAKTEQPT